MNHPNRSKHWRMPPEKFLATLELLTDGNQSEFARLIGVDGRTVRRWVSGELLIPKPVQALIKVMLSLTDEQRLAAFRVLRGDLRMANRRPSAAK